MLGPVELVVGDARIALGGPKQRLVLGLLAARRGRVVPVDELIDGLWPEGPQARPRKTVQVYVTRLRRALGDHADAIRSEAAGYVLDPGVLRVDADVFEAGLRAARDDDDDWSAVATLRAVLGRWRGDAFVDLRDCAALFPSAVHLDELRLVALQELFAREVQLRPGAVIGELEQLVEAHPLHEGFAAQLMTAQYRAGRQADALATYKRLRRRLADELGLDPGPAVRELQGRILRQELAVARDGRQPILRRQRRRITVLAAEITLATEGALDPEDELAILAPARRSARARILEHGGLVIADAGDRIAASFGFPSSDHPVEQAVAAALAVAEIGRGEGRVRTSVGVDTGMVVIESESSDGATIALAGAPLRSAERWGAQAGPGQVVLGRATADSVADHVELMPTADGDSAVAVRLLAPAVDAPPLGVVGREDALTALAELARPAGDRLCTVLLTGPAGIGKTALAGAFVDAFARERGGAVVRLRGDDRPDLADPPTLVGRLRQQWRDALPILLVDDVDAADAAVAEVLELLSDHLPAGLIVLTSRSTATRELGAEAVPAIALGALDRSTARQLAASVAGSRRLPLDTLNEIADRSGGVPLYIAALTEAALAGPEDAPAVPASVYDSLMAVLDRLGPARDLAQRGAVLGTSFSLDELDLVLADGSDPAETRRDLTAMVDMALVHLEDGRFRFAHALLADAAYDSLLHADRIALHARVADALVAAGGPPERVAPHLEAAGRPFEAAVAWRRVAADDIRLTRNRQAQRHARAALRLLDVVGADLEPDGGETRRRALEHLAVGLQAADHGSVELVDVVARARASGVGRDDLARRVRLDILDISSHQARGDFIGATEIAHQCLDAAKASGSERWAAFARHFLGATLIWRGDLVRGTALIEAAVTPWAGDEAPDLASARAVGAMWTMLGLAAHLRDDPDADTLLARATAVVPAEDGYGRCLVSATNAIVDQLRGRPDAVRALVQPVWEQAMDLGSDFWMGWAQVLLGWAIAADDGPTGVAMMVEAIEQSSTRQALPYFSLVLGERLGEQGLVGEALARLAHGVAVAGDTGEEIWLPMLHLEQARWLAIAGDESASRRAGEDAVALAMATGNRFVPSRHAAWRAVVA